MARTGTAPPRRGRPPGTEAMTRDQVIRAAADLVDRDGWSALTLARLARELGRHSTSMYSHVESLEDLRKAISLLSAEELAARVWAAAIGETGPAALASIAVAYRSFAADHPGRTASLSSISRDDPEFAARMQHLHEPLAATFRSFGLDASQCEAAHQIFGATINGLVSTGGAELLDEAVDLFVRALSTETWPGTRATGRAARSGRRR